MSVTLLLLMMLSACGDPQVQSQASTDKGEFDKAIAHAQSVGVPDTLLNPIRAQANKLSGTHEPVTLFSSQPATNYYSNVAKNYQTLTLQVRGLEYQSTQQYGHQASIDLKSFSSLLSQRQSQGYVEAQNFANTLTQVQQQMNQAQFPRQFIDVSQKAQEATESLKLLGTANDSLMSFKGLIKTLKDSNLDTTALEKQADEDVQQFRVANKPSDFHQIIKQLSAQTQTANTISTQAVPYLGQYRLGLYKTSIDKVKSFGGNPDQYQKQYDSDKALLDSGNFVKFSAQLEKDMTDIRLPLLQLQATHDVNQLMTDTKNWGHAHQYHDSWNGQSYDQAYDYWNGTLYDLQSQLSYAQTSDDFQAIIDGAKDQRTLFEGMQTDAGDTSPYNVAHQSDLTLMKAFNATKGKVILASLYNGALRVYQDGKLIHSMQVVSGMPEKPSPPGVTTVTNRQSPATFKSFEKDKNSPFYYPDTKINYAMMYHTGEYYFHDSWWRADDDYGPGKQFPHYAPNASNEGTHGCINMSLDEATWLWKFTTPTDPNGADTITAIVY
ncbi:L,D-transpeptidase [Dictyobacter alpinus]|nr:L,D-transpeptidase [Dictyobacter alpinus]